MFLIWKYFVLSFSALLPLVNPVGSSLIFLGLVGSEPIPVYRTLARRIGINMVLFLAVVDLVGSTILRFFGISLPIVQVSGGIVIAAIAWSMLNQKDSSPSEKAQAAADVHPHETEGWLEEKTFYPFTFPITVGPGCTVVMLTLEARATQETVTGTLLAQAGLMIAIVLLSISVYFCYAYAPRIAQKISPTTAHGILRVISFILFCIGIQIAWNGLGPLLAAVIHARTP